MTEPTQDIAPRAIPRATPRTYARCDWCKERAVDARLVGFVEQGSGPGVNLFACPTCRDLHGLVPLTDRP